MLNLQNAASSVCENEGRTGYERKVRYELLEKTICGLDFWAVGRFSSVQNILPFCVVVENWAASQLCYDSSLYVIKQPFC